MIEMKKGQTKRALLLLVSFLLLVGLPMLSPPAGMTLAGWRVVGIFFGVLLLWLFEAIDWPSFLALAALSFVPGLKINGIFASSFGNPIFAFLLFTFLCTYELSKTTFIRRVAVFFVDNPLARRSPWHFTVLFFASILFLGLFISPTVLFVIYLPILEEIYELLGLKKGDSAASMLMMGLVFLCGISSGMTPIAHVFPLISMGIYREMTGGGLDYGGYMLTAIPVGLAVFGAMLLMFRFVLRANLSGMASLDAAALRQGIPPVAPREKKVLWVFSLVVLLWVLPSLVEGLWPQFARWINGYGIAMPPLLGVVALSVLTEKGTPILNFKEAMTRGVPWASLIICGAALALGAAMTHEAVGLKDFLAKALGPFAGSLAPVVVLLFFFAWTALQTNLSSNIVTGTLVSTVAIPILLTMPSIHAGAAAALIGMLSAYAFATPPAMPSVAIAGGSGWTSAKSLLGYGMLLMAISVAAALFIGYPLGRLFLG
ncbi:hypothetical protein ABB02_00149 [Clostridiaceae bacterium JG1575]|nr:hypothetical protein ABB02_00149 [Clostridiaceae bacterium JG1575]